jgi:hypothetical protein
MTERFLTALEVTALGLWAGAMAGFAQKRRQGLTVQLRAAYTCERTSR